MLLSSQLNRDIGHDYWLLTKSQVSRRCVTFVSAIWYVNVVVSDNQDIRLFVDAAAVKVVHRAAGATRFVTHAPLATLFGGVTSLLLCINHSLAPPTGQWRESVCTFRSGRRAPHSVFGLLRRLPSPRPARSFMREAASCRRLDVDKERATARLLCTS